MWVACFAQPVQAATQSMNANIAFADPLEVSSTQDLRLPVLITINTFGSVWVDRQQTRPGEEGSDQRHDSVNFKGPDDQLMNFLTLAYGNDSQSGRMVPIKSVCSLDSGGDGSCAKIYGSIQSDKKNMYTGMDTIFLTNLNPSANKINGLSIFDLCAVYQ